MDIGIATGKVAGRLVGPAMPGRTGQSIPNARVTLTIDPPQMLRAPRATPPVLVLPDPINCTTDADGLLLNEHGSAGVELIATNAPEIELDDGPWSWRATVTGPSIRRLSWTFQLPAGGNVDIATGLLTALQPPTG